MSEALIKYILSELERYCTWSKTFENLVRKEQTDGRFNQQTGGD